MTLHQTHQTAAIHVLLLARPPNEIFVLPVPAMEEEADEAQVSKESDESATDAPSIAAPSPSPPASPKQTPFTEEESKDGSRTSSKEKKVPVQR